MAEERSFRDHCLVACAILQPELSHLQEEGFLDAKKILYIPAGLHIKTERLEERLTAQLQRSFSRCFTGQSTRIVKGRDRGRCPLVHPGKDKLPSAWPARGKRGSRATRWTRPGRKPTPIETPGPKQHPLS